MQVLENLENLIDVSHFLEAEDFEAGYTYELLNGLIVKRSSPHHLHQRCLFALAKAFDSFVNPIQAGNLYLAPVDVYLDAYNYVVPDLVFISQARQSILHLDGYIKGTPDLIAEIISPSSAKLDRGEKMKLYRHHQVSEYWIVDFRSACVEVYLLKEGEYELEYLEVEKGIVRSTVLTGLELEISQLFS
jgi:Uma2 family endonuclease